MRSWSAGVSLAALLLAGCSDGPADEAPVRDDAVVVASFDFAESELVAELYAQALEAAGVPVRRESRLGPRELVRPALRQGLVDVVPEYLGSALAAEAPDAAPGRGAAETHARLAAALRPAGLRVLQPAAAANQNGLAVTRQTAQRLGLATTSDLVAHAPRLSLTGPAECPDRPYCLVGLRERYGLSFGRFVPYDSERQRTAALEQGVVDVAVVFTTDGHLAAGDLVLLEDDRALQPAENLVPVVTERAVERWGPRVVAALDGVSRRLDSASLVFLDWRTAVAEGGVRAEARGWLLRRGLLSR